MKSTTNKTEKGTTQMNNVNVKETTDLIRKSFNLPQIQNWLRELGHDVDIFETESDICAYIFCLGTGNCGEAAKQDYREFIQAVRTHLENQADDAYDRCRQAHEDGRASAAEWDQFADRLDTLAYKFEDVISVAWQEQLDHIN